MKQKFIAIIISILALKSPIKAQTSGDKMWYNIGLDCYSKMKFDEATYWFGKSIMANYNIAMSYGYKAAAEIYSGRKKDAQQDLDSAFRIEPANPNLYYFKGVLFKTLLLDDSAIYYIRKAVMLEPKNDDFVDGLAMAYLKKQIFLDSSKIYLTDSLLKALAIKKALDSALYYEVMAVKNEPNNNAYIANSGLIKEHMGKYNEALSDFTIALRIDPGGPVTLANIAFCKGKLKEYTEALNICNNIIFSNPIFAFAYIVRGEIYIDIGQKNKACADFNKVATLNGTENTGKQYEKKYACPITD